MKTAFLGLTVFWLVVLYIVASAFACDATCKVPSGQELFRGLLELRQPDSRACLDRVNVVRNAYRQQVLADCVRTFKHRYELIQ
jgi:hypothetical protein